MALEELSDNQKIRKNDNSYQIFQQLNLSLNARPADLSLADWQKLLDNLAKN